MADSDELYAAVNNFGSETTRWLSRKWKALRCRPMLSRLSFRSSYRSMIAQGRASEVLDSIGGAPSSTAVAALSHLAAILQPLARARRLRARWNN